MHYAQQSDPVLNRQFRRLWTEPAGAPRAVTQPQPEPPGAADDPELRGHATLARWRDEWRAVRASEARA